MPVSDSSRPSTAGHRVAEVVDDHHVVTGLDEPDDRVRPDVAGTTTHENLHAGQRIDRRPDPDAGMIGACRPR